ncbi:hypothetical protein [Paenibacillus whitsoniae]|uniref:Uncharacterized protein n=1 Tax=Paenibacillus whitsoniae TaxID=2496558 RepID=A0A3S0C8H2_9BACL|nr:hypothetical protein [Paenibacillus whitsoniae]RTE08333.1 hypothetical protein EJQ19_18080 [Paenibacillus whitsoniae]
MKSRQKNSPFTKKRKIAAGIVSLTAILTASAGISYADLDIAGSMASWFSKKSEQAMQSLDQSMKSETEAQKEALKKELQLRLEAASHSLDAYTEEQKRAQLDILDQYAQRLLDKMDLRTAQDREQILNKLQAIVASAEAGMNALADSYTPPALVYVPSPGAGAPGGGQPQPQPQPAQPQPAQPQPAEPQPAQPPTVTTDVYGPQETPATVVTATYNES